MSERVNDEDIKEQLQLVIFTLEKEEFGIEINQVREIVRLLPITPLPKVPDFIEGVINLRGEILAVMDLAKKFAMPAHNKTEQSRIIVVDIKNTAMGLVVDSVPEVIRINIDHIQSAPEMTQSKVQNNFIKGVGKVDDRLIILIHLEKILTTEEHKAMATVKEKDISDLEGV